MTSRRALWRPTEPAVPAWSLTPYLLFAPFWQRVLLGEGALLAVNAAIVWFSRPDLPRGAGQLLVSTLVLAALYSFNDLNDAENDRRDPLKNQRLVEALLQHRGRFSVFLHGLEAALVLLSLLLLGTRTALVVLALFAVNRLYSQKLKGVPFLDFLVVVLWGALYAAIPETPWHLCLVIGLMTTICHAFQMLTDRDVDARNRIRTTAVLSTRTTTLALAVSCAALCAALVPALGAWSAAAFLPLALRLGIPRAETGWMLTRLTFAPTLIVMLAGPHGVS